MTAVAWERKSAGLSEDGAWQRKGNPWARAWLGQGVERRGRKGVECCLGVGKEFERERGVGEEIQITKIYGGDGDKIMVVVLELTVSLGISIYGGRSSGRTVNLLLTDRVDPGLLLRPFDRARTSNRI